MSPVTKDQLPCYTSSNGQIAAPGLVRIGLKVVRPQTNERFHQCSSLRGSTIVVSRSQASHFALTVTPCSESRSLVLCHFILVDFWMVFVSVGD